MLMRLFFIVPFFLVNVLELVGLSVCLRVPFVPAAVGGAGVAGMGDGQLQCQKDRVYGEQ